MLLKLPLPITDVCDNGPKIDAMKSSSVEESASTMLVAEDLEGSLIAATVFEADDDDPLVMWFA